eukprot:CAMPEP_0170524312 /NCGR_PEP_ID=MMETSP0209-20121228/9735_1 /TAXON_ID=665100 ORGANISM="Litonotus pictus, Strain P1" /NCGR_SAMPLE_ID=MMETSP0209 /ASSEMBLY_ACC=CAM_ASM_000301 /LENGTH=766 /DNA_ID=CAMNT_0010812909 /DNA_START=274 /DNA_END=2574 /DNA_ORIENTATION=+
MDVIRLGELDQSNSIGITLTDSDCIDQFSNLIEPIINDVHDLVDKGNNVVIKHNYKVGKNTIVEKKEEDSSFINFPFQNNINSAIKSLKVEFSRNLEDFPFSSIITKEKRESITKNIKAAISTLSANEPLLKKGRFISISSEEESSLVDILREVGIDYEALKSYMITTNMNSSWPDNRAIYVSENKELVILINFVDHLKFIYNITYVNDYLEVIERAYNIVKSFERIINFEINSNYGYINSCPSLFGAGMEIFANISVTNLTKYHGFENLLEKANFDSFAFDEYNSELKLKSTFKLKYSSEFEFAKLFYQKLSALAILDADKNKLDALSFGRKEFEEESGETYTTYFHSFEAYENKISPSGSTINSLLVNPLNLESLYGSFVFKELCDINYFKNLMFNYFKFSANKDLNVPDIYTSVSEEDMNFPEIKDPSKVSSVRFSIRRNLESTHFTCSKFSDNDKTFNSVNQFLQTQSFLTNVEVADSNEYLSLLQSLDNNNDDNENIQSIISIHNAIIKNVSDFAIAKNSPLQSSSIKYDISNRKVVKFDFKDLKDILIYINDLDHFRLEYLLLHKSITHNNFKKLLKLLGEVSQSLNFAFDENFGYLGPLPKFFGTGMVLSIGFVLETLEKNSVLFSETCKKFNFSAEFKKDSNNKIVMLATSKSLVGVQELTQLKNTLEFINEVSDLDESLQIRSHMEGEKLEEVVEQKEGSEKEGEKEKEIKDQIEENADLDKDEKTNLLENPKDKKIQDLPNDQVELSDESKFKSDS